MKRVKVMCLWVVIGIAFFAFERLLATICPIKVYCPYILILIFSVCVGFVTRIDWFNKKSMFFQSISSMLLLVIIVLVNNISEISLPVTITILVKYGMLWFLLSPTAFWLEDMIRYKLWDEGKSYSIKVAYYELMNLGGRGRK